MCGLFLQQLSLRFRLRILFLSLISGLLISINIAIVTNHSFAIKYFSKTKPHGWDWPLEPKPQILTKFSKPKLKWQPGHRGVDLAGQNNQTVFAAGAGKVEFVGNIAHVPIISIVHKNNLRTTYQPVAATVTKGEIVSLGQPIGTLLNGHVKCAPATCLHWGLLRGNAAGAKYLNPLILIYGTGVRLIPD